LGDAKLKPHEVKHRGVEQWQLVGLITRRSVVRIHPPLPGFVLHNAVEA
jgi:hypothetical protein